MDWLRKKVLKVINKLKQEHRTIEFDFRYSKAKTEFIYVLVQKYIKNKVQTYVYVCANIHLYTYVYI